MKVLSHAFICAVLLAYLTYVLFSGLGWAYLSQLVPACVCVCAEGFEDGWYMVVQLEHITSTFSGLVYEKKKKSWTR